MFDDRLYDASAYNTKAVSALLWPALLLDSTSSQIFVAARPSSSLVLYSFKISYSEAKLLLVLCSIPSSGLFASLPPDSASFWLSKGPSARTSSLEFHGAARQLLP